MSGGAKRKVPARRMGPEGSATRDAMLDAAEAVLRDEGFAALSARRVAEVAGFKHQLVYYYFATMDDLILDAFRRRAERSLGRLETAVASERPLHAIWDMYVHPANARLILEFTAIAARNAALRSEILRYLQRSRAMQEAILARILEERGVDQSLCTPAVAAMLMASVTQFIDRETVLGATEGHDQLRRFVDWALERLDLRR